MPAEGATMKFKKYKDTMEGPFMVYADWANNANSCGVCFYVPSMIQ